MCSSERSPRSPAAGHVIGSHPLRGSVSPLPSFIERVPVVTSSSLVYGGAWPSRGGRRSRAGTVNAAAEAPRVRTAASGKCSASARARRPSSPPACAAAPTPAAERELGAAVGGRPGKGSRGRGPPRRWEPDCVVPRSPPRDAALREAVPTLTCRAVPPDQLGFLCRVQATPQRPFPSCRESISSKPVRGPVSRAQLPPKPLSGNAHVAPVPSLEVAPPTPEAAVTGRRLAWSPSLGRPVVPMMPRGERGFIRPETGGCRATRADCH